MGVGGHGDGGAAFAGAARKGPLGRPAELRSERW